MQSSNDIRRYRTQYRNPEGRLCSWDYYYPGQFVENWDINVVWRPSSRHIYIQVCRWHRRGHWSLSAGWLAASKLTPCSLPYPLSPCLQRRGGITSLGCHRWAVDIPERRLQSEGRVATLPSAWSRRSGACDSWHNTSVSRELLSPVINSLESVR